VPHLSIFINPELFEIEIKYDCILESNQIIGIKCDEKGEHSVVFLCQGRSVDEMSDILEESTIINHVTGRPMIRTKVFYKMVILKFMNKIKEKDVVVDINDSNYSKIHYDVIKNAVKKWVAVTGGKYND
jgi:hypothetical protein